MNEYEELERKEKIMQLEMRRIKAQENNFKRVKKKEYETEKKMKERANNVQKVLKIKEKENLENIKKNQEKYDNVIKEHLYLVIMDKMKRDDMAVLLENKSKKIDYFKEKKILENEKNNINKEIINNKRREFELEFKSLFHDKKVDDRLKKKITEFFPNNNELINIVEKIENLEHEEIMQKKKKREKSNKLYEKKYGNKDKNIIRNKTPQKIKSKNNAFDENNFFMNTLNQNLNDKNNYNNFNDINKNTYYSQQKDYNNVDDKEILIMDKLNEFKIQINKELVDLISLEEKKEEERIKLYSNTPINKKEEIMSIINEERKKSNNFIKNIIANNENKINEYENELRKKLV